tara:strand:- start:35223 stop:37172 length:1950 start_codon:yes stop_codon:yes gene_type:complete
MINITFPDGTIKKMKAGITSLEIAMEISEGLARNILSATVNDKVWDLNRPINEDCNIKLNSWSDSEGKSCFWHSSAHLLAEALEFFYPGIQFGIGPSIETGFYYDIDLNGNSISSDDFEKIEVKMKELAKEKNKFYRRDISKKDALEYFKNKGDNLKLELLKDLEDGKITFYKQGNFTDLCKGPHLPDTSKIKAVKLLNIAGAYWKGDESKKQLTRIYGISFTKEKDLKKHMLMLEEAKKRDHRKIGKEMELFTFSKKVGQGLPLWLPKGAKIREKLENFLKDAQIKAGYQPVVTPHIGNKDLYVCSGHYDKYGEDSFQPIKTPNENEEFFLKPMNCPHHCEIYKSKVYSYKDLPVRFAEFGTVYRYEQSGELHGLTRVRSFTQDDAHIFARQDQVKDEFKNVIDLVLYVFNALGFNEFKAQISLRDKHDKKKYIGSDENWKKAEESIIDAAKEKNLRTIIEYGEAAFYGPKLDFMVKDAIGREWQLGTIQVDYSLPERFELEYTDSDNTKKRPVMIHRAPFGSMERFVAVLIEHCAGNFPLWLLSDKCIILPISEKHHDYAEKVSELLKNYDICGPIDERAETTGKKIRDAEVSKIPFIIVLGDKEKEQKNISVRKHGGENLGSLSINDFVKLIEEEIKELITIKKEI